MTSFSRTTSPQPTPLMPGKFRPKKGWEMAFAPAPPFISLLQDMITDPHKRSRRARGFTLVEVMITVAIIGILVGIALPAYRDYIRKSRRSEAQAYLMTLASRQQQFLVDTRSYAGALATINVPMPHNVTAAYDVVLVAVAGPPPSFVLTATPKPGTDQVRESCGPLTINQTGTKTALLPTCW